MFSGAGRICQYQDEFRFSHISLWFAQTSHLQPVALKSNENG
jgi:hypothetical protein